jgi:hypothetical protein
MTAWGRNIQLYECFTQLFSMSIVYSLLPFLQKIIFCKNIIKALLYSAVHKVTKGILFSFLSNFNKNLKHFLIKTTQKIFLDVRETCLVPEGEEFLTLR